MTHRDNVRPGSAERPLRVAVIGSGPAGFYVADALLKARDLVVEIDMFERLPAPFGLVRSGVAPDHQRIKQAARAFERTAAHAGFRFFGNVTVGVDVGVDELRALYDQVVLATGSAIDRKLGVPGEELAGVHSALSFVGWYNGHPDFTTERFDLSVSRAAVIGVGNVAMDVTRTLIRRPDELEETDIASYALDVLRESRVREVLVLGRRGPAQAAFTQSELEDIAGLDGVQVRVDAEPLRQARSEPDLDSTALRLLDFLEELADAPELGAERVVRLRFLISPCELAGDGRRVRSLVVEQNALAIDDGGLAAACGTGCRQHEEAGLVLRAIGFAGVPIPGVPFDERRGIVPNLDGRVIDATGAPIPGLYAVGWIKRGPRGLIGANKGDAAATAERMLEDARAIGPVHAADQTPRIEALLRGRGVRVVSFPEWRVLDEMERATGRKMGKVREKFTSIEAMLRALDTPQRRAESA